MMVKDLKIYNFIIKHAKLFEDFRFQISYFFQVNPANTRKKYHVLTYWAPHLIVSSDLSMLNYEVLLYKDSLVSNADGNFVLYNNPENILFSNSSVLLHSFLLKLHKGWTCLPDIIEQLPLTITEYFGDLGSKLLIYFLELIPVMDEIIRILYTWHSALFLSYHPFIENNQKLNYILYKSPLQISDGEFVGYVNYSKEDWIDLVISDFNLNEDFVRVFNSLIRRDLEYDHRLDNDLFFKEVIAIVLKELLSDINVKTLGFLGLNHMVYLFIIWDSE